MCLLCAILCGIWEKTHGYYFQQYLPWDKIILEGSDSGNVDSGSASIAVLIFFSYLIVLNTLVPISLYVRWVITSISVLALSLISLFFVAGLLACGIILILLSLMLVIEIFAQCALLSTYVAFTIYNYCVH